jgi:hypothetical protein
MGSRAKLNSSSFLLGAPFSTDSVFITWDLNLDMRFVPILNYKHVRTAGLTVQSFETGMTENSDLDQLNRRHKTWFGLEK